LTLETDQKPITFLPNKKEPNKRLARWLERLDYYQFTIKNRAGKDNVVADMLITERFLCTYLTKILAKIKSSVQPMQAELIFISASSTNQMIPTDFTGPFFETQNKNKYLLIITCLFFKYLVLVAVPNKETATAAKAIFENLAWNTAFPRKF
jgi:hypothetical protein